MRLCVLGGINWDVVTHVADLPRRGETVASHKLEQSPGGKGLNQAVAAARFGADVLLLGAMGDDAIGASLRGFLAEVGIDDAGVLADPGLPTGQAHICLDAAGDNMIVVSAGANAGYGAAQAAAVDLSACGVFVTQFEASLDAIETVFGSAAARRGIRILNAAPALLAGRPLLGLADILIVNETELERFAGLAAAPTTEPEMIAAARALIGQSGQRVIVTLGGDGCLLVAADAAEKIAGHRVPVVDTIGAGDCFCGVLGAGLAEGLPLPAAIALANAAAALSVGRSGAASASPMRAEIEAFFGARASR